MHWAAFSAFLPQKVLWLGIWLSGLITATIVTVTHQSEEIFIKDTLRKYDFAEAQFRSTRDAMCSNWFSDILWGGMQWQLEHHIFPTMPRYRYPAVSKILKEAARCHRHNPCAYVRIIATVPENATQKVTYIIHKPAEKPVQRR